MEENGICSAAFYESAALPGANPLRLTAFASSPKGAPLGTAGNFALKQETVSLPLKPSPTGGRWRAAPDEGQHLLAQCALSVKT